MMSYVESVKSKSGKKKENKLMAVHVYFGFKNGRLETVILSRNSDRETAIDCDYYIDEPQDAEKQIEEWKKQSSTRTQEHSEEIF